MTKTTNLISTFTFFIIFLNVFLFGTSMKELTLQEMCVNSTDIIFAHVIMVNSFWNDDHNRIFSEIELEVDNNIKGQQQINSRIKIFCIGGSIDGIKSFVIGGPHFDVGKNYVLMLTEMQSADYGTYFSVVGLPQGKFNLITLINNGTVFGDDYIPTYIRETPASRI
ncbi:MAG: hypothetical protein H8E61_00010 [Bacteroidetes bacterium]|nr:hypothetical protein [Bacteroidota bacterium]